MPCRRCGRVIAATRGGRHAHKCPHGMQCYPRLSEVCQECKKSWATFAGPANTAEFEAQHRIIMQAKG